MFGTAAYYLHGSLGWVGTDILAPAGVVLSIVVTLHVLLRKREIGSAIGWIGLAWLSPIFGSILYFMFGINRVNRRAQRLRDRRHSIAQTHTAPPDTNRDDHLAPLEEAVGRITGRPAETGNCIDIYHNGDEAYPVMLRGDRRGDSAASPCPATSSATTRWAGSSSTR